MGKKNKYNHTNGNNDKPQPRPEHGHDRPPLREHIPHPGRLDFDSSLPQHAKTPAWKFILVLIIGFVLGFGAAWLSFNRPDAGTNADGTNDVIVVTDSEDNDTVSAVLGETTNTDLPMLVAETDRVLVKDQNAGMTVFLTRVEVTNESWVAIREDVDGELGNILGAYRFPAGVQQGTVDLLRGTQSGARYHAVMYVDDGDKMFDHTKDALVVDTEGNVAGMTFKAL